MQFTFSKNAVNRQQQKQQEKQQHKALPYRGPRPETLPQRANIICVVAVFGLRSSVSSSAVYAYLGEWQLAKWLWLHNLCRCSYSCKQPVWEWQPGNLATWLTGNWQHLASWLLRRTPMHIQCHNPNGILMLNAYSPDCCRRRLTADSQITRFSGNDLHYLLYYPACR